MTAKTKTFDCVKMKNRIQSELMAEYEKRRDEFESYDAFLKAKADGSPWVRKMRRRFGAPPE